MKSVSKISILLFVFCLTAVNSFAQTDVGTFIEENPDTVSVLCTQGDETIVSHHADEKLTLASTSKVIILAEYARQVANGNLDPEEVIPMDEIEAYYIALTDGNAHPQWLSSLEDADSATLSQIVDSMIIYSSNTGADYIHSRLESDGFEDLYELLELENTDLPNYFLGNLLALSNHETGVTDSDYVDSLDEDTFLAEHDRLLDLFLNDEDWRSAELDFRDDAQVGTPAIAVQAQFFDRFSTQSTANDLLKLIQSAFSGDALSDETRAVMQDHLGWLFDVNPANADVYEALATKGGAYSGILTSIWYADAIGFDPVTLVVLYHDLPEDIWLEWLGSSAQQGLELAVVASPAGCSVFSDILP